MISVVLYGRNDNYGYNLHKRAALSLNCIAELLDGSDELLFVDYNTPDDFPTFPEAIQDTLTSRARDLLRILRVRPFIHDRFKSRTRLLALEPIARNIAVRRSQPSNRWILSTNTDMIFVLQRASSLPDLVRDLPKGFYHAPRIELPETLWEGLDRHRPKEVIDSVRDWGWSLHLNEIVLGNDVIHYDGPGDFQLFEREDLFKYHGFHEDMLLGWHVDSNIAKRFSLVYGKVGDLGNDLYGYHCDHTRQVTAAHSHVRTENDVTRFFENVLTPTISEQAESWGCMNDEIEEIRLTKNSSQAYVKALQEVIGGPLGKPINTLCNGLIFNNVDYDPRHVIPFLADVFESSPRSINVAWYGGHREMLTLFAGVWQKLGFTGKILIDESFIPKLQSGAAKVASVSTAAAYSADAFIFNFGDVNFVDQGGNDAGPPSVSIDGLRASFIGVVENERERIRAGAPARRIITLNAVYNRFETLVHHCVSAATSPFSTRLRHGFVVPVPDLMPNSTVDFRLGGNGSAFKSWGWSGIDGAGTWTDGREASLAANLSRWPRADMLLEVTGRPFLVRGRQTLLRVDVVANGTTVARWTYRHPWDNDKGIRRAWIPAKVLIKSTVLKLGFRIYQPVSPMAMGVSGDSRELGLSIAGISFHVIGSFDYLKVALQNVRYLRGRARTLREVIFRNLWPAAMAGK